MFSTALMLVLLAGAIVCYVRGVKPRKRWGKPALVGCCLALALVVGAKLPFGKGAAAQGPSQASLAYKKGRELGKGLRETLPTGARIFFFSEWPVNPQTRGAWQEAEDGFSDGLGHRDWQREGVICPSLRTAEGFSNELAGTEGKIDVIVSFGGLPRDLEKMSVYKQPERPKVAAFFPSYPLLVNAGMIRQWLQDDLLDAAVVDDGSGLKLYTPENLP
jgi:hypothetical protein